MLSLLLSLSFLEQKPVATTTLVKQSIVRYSYLYGIEPDVLDSVIRCESFYGEYMLNPNEVHGESIGVGQFRKSTFDYYSKEAMMKNPDIWDIEDSVQLTAFMIRNGYGSHFSCYRKLKL